MSSGTQGLVRVSADPCAFPLQPPPPQLGYSVSSEDLDADKLATLQRFNKVLQDKAAGRRAFFYSPLFSSEE